MPTALLSVADKTKLVEFTKGLSSLDWEFIASGGTAKMLRENKVSVTDVAEYTGSPEILGGRVKTLHPAVHGGILAREGEDDAADLEKITAKPIDLIAVNLYPFRETIASPNVTLEDAIEKIDIGGVALLRAAAKNFHRVTVIVDSDDYEVVLQELREKGETSLETRRRLAVKAFAHTQSYDAAISAYLAPGEAVNMPLFPIQSLRYGENPVSYTHLRAHET